MIQRYLRLFVISAALLLLSSGAISARPKACGAEFSFSGLCINFQASNEEDTFDDFCLGIDFYRFINGEIRHPGVRFTYVRDYVLASFSRDDFDARWFAGPGMTAGYVQDRNAGFGTLIGLCGNVGIEFDFRMPVCISLSLMPSLATHIIRKDNSTDLNIYFNGLVDLLSPRLGIKYSF